MAAGVDQRRQPRPKRLTVAEIDAFFRAYVDTDRADSTLANIGETVELPCDFDTAIELWAAWDKGILPRAGGYLDQPRWFRQLMRLLNSRHAPIQRQYMAAKYPDQYKPQDDETQWIEDGMDAGQPFELFERLKG